MKRYRVEVSVVHAYDIDATCPEDATDAAIVLARRNARPAYTYEPTTTVELLLSPESESVAA